MGIFRVVMVDTLPALSCTRKTHGLMSTCAAGRRHERARERANVPGLTRKAGFRMSKPTAPQHRVLIEAIDGANGEVGPYVNGRTLDVLIREGWVEERESTGYFAVTLHVTPAGYAAVGRDVPAVALDVPAVALDVDGTPFEAGDVVELVGSHLKGMDGTRARVTSVVDTRTVMISPMNGGPSVDRFTYRLRVVPTTLTPYQEIDWLRRAITRMADRQANALADVALCTAREVDTAAKHSRTYVRRAAALYRLVDALAARALGDVR